MKDATYFYHADKGKRGGEEEKKRKKPDLFIFTKGKRRRKEGFGKSLHKTPHFNSGEGKGGKKGKDTSFPDVSGKGEKRGREGGVGY